jgi:hypothetical protein
MYPLLFPQLSLKCFILSHFDSYLVPMCSCSGAPGPCSRERERKKERKKETKSEAPDGRTDQLRPASAVVYSQPSYFVVALCFVLMLCAHAWCFVLCASCSCFLLIGFFGHCSTSTKHEACAPSRWPAAAGQSSCSQNRVFLSRTAKHKARSMSTKQPILTKRCDFEHKARSAKHKAQSMSIKQRQKN